MSIVRRKDSAGRTYYINDKTGVRTTEAAYKRSKTATKNLGPYQLRAGNKPSNASCSSAGRALKVKQTSTAGKRLRSCR